ncbi:MAG: CopG family transcriptional regulator [Acidimicrobiia bacterium]
MGDKTKTHLTKTGKVLTDTDIDALAVEGDFEVDALKTRRRGRPSMGSAAAEVVPVRLDPALKEAVESRAEREQTTTSEIIRAALRRFLAVA